MKRIIKLCLFLMLFGCNNHTYKHFEFESKGINVADGEASARLLGSFVLVHRDGNKKETHKGSPYELLIWFETNNPTMKAERIEAISLTSSEGAVVAKSDGGALQTEVSSSKSYLNTFSLKELKLKHLPHVLRYKLVLRTGNGEVSKNIEIQFIPKYEEKRSNDFIDRLMSV